MSTVKRPNIATITKIGVLSALAVALMFLEIPHFFTPFFWLKFDFADVPALIGGFAMGPLAGGVIVFIKIIITFFIKGTITFGVGELANLILSLALVLPSAIIYKRKKSLKRAIIGLISGVLVMVILAPILNYFVLIPIFIAVGGLPPEFIEENGGMVFYLFAAAVPVTAIKAVMQSIVVVLLYKPLSGILHKQTFKREKKTGAKENRQC